MSKRVENTVGRRRKVILRIIWAAMTVGVTGLMALTGSRGWVGAQAVGAWSTPANLSESTTASYYPDIAVDSAGHAYVVWGEYTSDHDGQPDLLMFRMWDGQSWSLPNDLAVGGHLPQIAVDSQGRLHVIRIANGLEYKRAWAQGDPSNAGSWIPGRDLSFRNPYWPDMVIDSQDRIHVVFRDTMQFDEERTIDRERLCATGCQGIFYTRSIDGGDSWSDPIQLDTPMVDATTPRLAVDRLGNVYAFWADATADESPIAISFSYSTDGGETWSPSREVVKGEEGYEYPQAAVDSLGIIHVVWYYSRVGHVGCVRSLDGGESWSQEERLRLPLGSVYSIGLAIDSGDNLHLVVPSMIDGLPGVSHLVRSPGGEWLSPTSISRNPCSAASADVELVISEGNHLHAVWYDRLECESGWIGPSGRGEVFYSDFVSDAPHIAPRPLPPMPTPTATMPTAQLISTPEPTMTGTPTATPWSPAASSAENAQTGRWVPNPLLVGPVLAGALVGVVVILKSAMIGRP
jgi:hypothetical protein